MMVSTITERNKRKSDALIDMKLLPKSDARSISPL